MLAPQPVRVVPEAFVDGGSRRRGGSEDARPRLRFGLHLGTSGSPAARRRPGTGWREIAAAAEAAGFDAIYVMDHFRQIPQIGRAWDDFLESYTTLGYLAACTRAGRGSARWSPGSRTGTSGTSARSSPRSTC